MKWLQDNPVGMILAGASGLFLLIALVMTIIWNIPVSVDPDADSAGDLTGGTTSLAARQIGELNEYLVINEKPVFNESRTPTVSEVGEEDEQDDGVIEVKGAPDVKLTGVVITLRQRIASLTPADANIETVRAKEGDSLTGEFVGWQVSEINPRTVVLKSRDGQFLELDLQVHDVKIEEPPTPVAPTVSAVEAALPGSAAADDAEDEPLSRAEQIRQRIAQRREELRLEQEAQQSAGANQASAEKQPPKPSAYQSAIRAMMKKKSEDSDSNEKNDR